MSTRRYRAPKKKPEERKFMYIGLETEQRLLQPTKKGFEAESVALTEMASRERLREHGQQGRKAKVRRRKVDIGGSKETVYYVLTPSDKVRWKTTEVLHTAASAKARKEALEKAGSAAKIVKRTKMVRKRMTRVVDR